jgi:hypothetical protein
MVLFFMCNNMVHVQLTRRYRLKRGFFLDIWYIKNNTIKEHKLSNPFAFWYQGEDISVKAYNVDTNGNELKVNDKKSNRFNNLFCFSINDVQRHSLNDVNILIIAFSHGY